MTTAARPRHTTANLLALATIALWASLATLGASLAHVPPFLLTGLGLLAGSVIALPLVRFDLRRLAAPGLFSTTTCWPSTLASSAAISRVLASGPVPAGKGAMIFSGLLGYSCAWTGERLAAPVAASSTSSAVRRVGRGVFMACLLVRVGYRGQASAAIGLRSVPIWSTTISQTSPGFIHTGGLRRAPTPPGVPVTITSPGCSGAMVET